MNLKCIERQTETSFGKDSGAAICPPEIDRRIAWFDVEISKSEIEVLTDGMEEGFEIDDFIEAHYKDGKITITFSLTGEMIIGRTGAVYERMRL